MQQLQIKNIYMRKTGPTYISPHKGFVNSPHDGSLPISNTNNWSTYIFDSASVSIHPMVWTCIKIHRNSLEIYDQNDAIIFRCASDKSEYEHVCIRYPWSAITITTTSNHIATASHPRFICFQAFPLSEQILICMTMSDGRTVGSVVSPNGWNYIHYMPGWP